MSAYVLTSQTVLLGTAWTGTAPGPGVAVGSISGTISSASDITSYVRSAPVGWSVAQQDTTNMGSGGYTEVIPGLTSHDQIVLDCNSDQAASALDSIVRSTLGGVASAGSDPIYVDVKPTSASRGSTNPSLVAAVYIVQWSPFGGSVGDRAAARLVLQVTGTFTQLTS